MMISFKAFDYINTIDKTGDFTKDVLDLLIINDKEDTKQHVIAVARTSRELSAKFNVDEEKFKKV